MVLANLGTVVPPLWLALVSHPSAGLARTLTRAADLTDAALFAAIAVFAFVVFLAVQAPWLRGLCLAVAILALVRAVASPLGGRHLRYCRAACVSRLGPALECPGASWARGRLTWDAVCNKHLNGDPATHNPVANPLLAAPPATACQRGKWSPGPARPPDGTGPDAVAAAQRTTSTSSTQALTTATTSEKVTPGTSQ